MGVAEIVIGRFCGLLCFLSCVTYLVGFSTPWWLEGKLMDARAGLWLNCVGDHCASTIKIELGDWLIACQALSLTALLTSMVALGVILTMLCKSRSSAVSTARYGAIATTLLTGLAISITLAIYYLRRELTYPAEFYTLSVSFFLVLVAGAIFLALSLVLTIDAVIARLRQSSQS